MNNNSCDIPYEIIPEKYLFERSYLSKMKMNNSFFNKTSKRESSIFEKSKNFNLKINPLFKPISLKNKIRKKFLGTKLNSKRNDNSLSKVSLLHISNDEKNVVKKGNKKLDIIKLKSLLKKRKIHKIKGANLTYRNKLNNLNKFQILKKNNSCETLLNKNLKINSKQKAELFSKFQKYELKKRLNRDIKKHIIINQKTLQKYDFLFKMGLKRKNNSYIEENKNDPDEAINNNNLYKANYTLNDSKSFKINNYYNCFSVFRSTFRYEDYYFTPLEFLKKYFKNNEIILMKSFPAYFGLNKSPFKESNLIFKPSLLQKIEYEDKIKNKKLNSNINIININKNKDNINKKKKSNSKEKKRKNNKLININLFKKRKRKKLNLFLFFHIMKEK